MTLSFVIKSTYTRQKISSQWLRQKCSFGTIQGIHVHSRLCRGVGYPISISKFNDKQYSTSLVSQRGNNGNSMKMSISDTALGQHKKGSLLLDGLDVYTISANGDSHPLTVYGIESETTTRKPILLLHGRTWSSVPVYHLLGGPRNAKNGDHESLSFMEALLKEGLQPYSMDFRGFGGTPNDASNVVEPNRCVEDVESVLSWIGERHEIDKDDNSMEMPVLFGWSQGALVAQLLAQKSPNLISKLVLYGSIYDPMIRYPRVPLFTNDDSDQDIIYNNYDGAIEDFTVEGSINSEQAKLFAEAALLADPIKARWTHLYQFNNCDPARVHVPTLVVCIYLFMILFVLVLVMLFC